MGHHQLGRANYVFSFLKIVLLLFALIVFSLSALSRKPKKLTCAIADPIRVTVNANCVTIRVNPAHWPDDPTTCNVTIDWGDGNITTGVISTPTTFTHCYSGCGKFYYHITRDCGGSGCITTYDDTLEITIPLNVTISNPIPCEGDTITLEAQVPPSSTYTPVPPLTYTWDFGDGTNATGNPVQHVYTPAGTYVGTVTVIDATGCYGTESFIITVNPTPQTVLPDTLEKCLPDTVLIDLSVFSGLAPYTYQWTPSGYLSCTTCEDPLASPPSDTMYYVTVTDANGCQANDSVFIDVHPQPELTALNDTICPNDTTTISITLVSGTSPFQWSWQPTNGLSCTNCPAPLVYPDTTTLYQITVTDANGCWDTAFALVYVWPQMDILLPDTHFVCFLDSVTLSPVVSGGTPPYIEFIWTPDTALTCDTCLQTDAFPRDTTTYIIRILDSKGCYHYDTTTVVVWPLPILRVPDTSICMYDTILIYPGGPYVSYTWTPNYNISCTFCDSVYVWPHDTTRYKVVAVNEFGCVDSAAGWVNPVPWPVPMLPDSIAMCQGQKVLVYAGIAHSYEWNPQYGLSCVVCDSVWVFPEQNALYIVTYKNEIGCTLYDTMKVYVAPAPNAKAYPKQAICFGESATLFAEGGYHYHWMPAQLVSEPHYVEPNRQLVTHEVTVMPRTTTAFMVAVNTDTSLCQWDTAYVTVYVDSGAIVDAVKDTVVLLNDTAYIEGIYPSSTWFIGGEFPTNVFATWWQQQEGVPIEYWEPLQTYTPVLISDTGKWWFYFFVQTSNGCISYDSVLIHVIDVPCSDSVVFHPLAFTPNGDGVNDVLQLYSQRPAFVKLWRIYDRWGNMLFEARNFWVFLDQMTTEGWDGTYDGRLLRPDVYVYYLFVDCDGTVYFEKGDVTLIR